MEFSKKLIVFASVMYGMTWALSMGAHFVSFAEVPESIWQHVTWLYGVAIALYTGKSTIENKAKIETSNLNRLNGKAVD